MFWNIVAFGPSAEIPRKALQHLTRRPPAELISAILTSLAEDPLEDGVFHPAEGVASSLLAQPSEEIVAELERMLTDESAHERTADALRLLGRFKINDTIASTIMESGLQHDSASIRDATVQALELSLSEELVRKMRQHHDPEQWIQSLIDQVLQYYDEEPRS